MTTINLNEYIRHGMIFKNLAENDLFDAIVYEQFDNPKVIMPDNFHVCQHHGSKLASELLAYHHTYDRLLIVLDTTSVSALLPFLEQLDPTKQVTICNLGAGISGLLTKGKAELHDLALLHHLGITCAEPFDFVSFFALLESKQTTYLRLPAKELGGNIFKADTTNISDGYIDLRSYELTGESGTVVIGGSLVNETIQAIGALDSTYDCFIQTHYFAPLSKEILESLQATRKLVVVGDYALEGQMIDWRTARLAQAGVTEITFQLISPLLDNTQAILIDLLYEQAGLSPEKIVERIVSGR